LMITVAGPGSSEVTGIEVLVDGEKQCAASPCRVPSIPAGTHLVNVRGTGYESTAVLAVTVSRGNESVLNVSLSRSGEERSTPAPTTAPAAKAPAEAATPSEPVAAARPEPAPAGAALAPAPKAKTAAASAAPPTAAAAGMPANGAASPEKGALGTLRIVSLPVANVLVDGRPIGSTPQVVRVPPGTHRVALVAGEQRRAQTVTLTPGGTQVVSVRF
jgi:hypothetical protein